MTEPEQWAVTEADIEGAPDWAFSLASTIVLGNYGCGHAAVLIQRAFEERERKLREAAEDQAWVEARELVRGTNADLCRGGAGQAYRLIIEGLTDAIHNRSLRTLWGRVEHRRARQALKETPDAG